MSFSMAVQDLKFILDDIESDLIKFDNHLTNANLSTIGAGAAYIITGNSKNNTTRTLGQIAALGGFLYSSREKRNAELIASSIVLNISKGLNLMEFNCNPYIRTEKNVNLIRTYLESTLRLGLAIDILLNKTLSNLKGKGILSYKNQQLFIHIDQIDIISCKLKYNKILKFIDRKKSFVDPMINYLLNTQTLQQDKLKQEGLLVRVVVFTLIISGVMLGNQGDLGAYLVVVGIGFWLVNHFMPLFPQSRKLKQAIRLFVSEITLSIGIRQLSLQ